MRCGTSGLLFFYDECQPPSDVLPSRKGSKPQAVLLNSRLSLLVKSRRHQARFGREGRTHCFPVVLPSGPSPTTYSGKILRVCGGEFMCAFRTFHLRASEFHKRQLGRAATYSVVVVTVDGEVMSGQCGWRSPTITDQAVAGGAGMRPWPFIVVTTMSLCRPSFVYYCMLVGY